MRVPRSVVALILLVLWAIITVPLWAALDRATGSHQLLVVVWEAGILFLGIIFVLEAAREMRHR